MLGDLINHYGMILMRCTNMAAVRLDLSPYCLVLSMYALNNKAPR